MTMTNLQTFNEFINESNLNEAAGESLDIVIKGDPDGKDGYEQIAKILGAKPSDVIMYDADEDGDSKEYKKFDKAFTGGDFKDVKGAEDYADDNMANVAYSKKLNVLSSYAGGYLTFFAKK